MISSIVCTYSLLTALFSALSVGSEFANPEISERYFAQFRAMKELSIVREEMETDVASTMSSRLFRFSIHSPMISSLCSSKRLDQLGPTGTTFGIGSSSVENPVLTLIVVRSVDKVSSCVAEISALLCGLVIDKDE